MKVIELSKVLFHDPAEFVGRCATFLEAHANRMRRPAELLAMNPEIFVRRLSDSVGVSIDTFLQEDGLQAIKAQVSSAQSNWAQGVQSFHDGTFSLAAICYAVCRARRPLIVLETGVGNGVTTSFILQALALNCAGELWSIDLPPLGSFKSGGLVPDNVKSRWNYVRGRTRAKLPEIVKKLQSIDVFVHDSLHTYRNMLFEFRTVWPAFSARGVLISDDISMNCAFEDFFRSKGAFFARREHFGAAVAN